MSTDLQVLEPLPPLEVLYDAMLKLPQAELPTLHYFADGMYLRWLFCPKGALIIGREHKRAHFFLVLSGAIQVGREVYTPPKVIVSTPGTQRAGLALQDSVCVTIHRTQGTDLAAIEEELLEPDPKSPFGVGNRLKALEAP